MRRVENEEQLLAQQYAQWVRESLQSELHGIGERRAAGRPSNSKHDCVCGNVSKFMQILSNS
jgi:hypothetical protein